MCNDSLLQQCPGLNPIIDALVERLRSGESFMALERWLFGFVLQLGLLILSRALGALLGDREFCSRACCEAREQMPHRMRSKGLVKVRLRTLFGSLEVKTSQWVEQLRGRSGARRQRRRGGGSGLYPVLWMWGVHERCTPALQAEVARAMVLGASCREASELLSSRGITLDPKQVCRLTYDLGQRSIRARDHLLAHPKTLAASARVLVGRRVVVAADGGRFRARINNTQGRRTRKNRRGFSTPWREPKGFVIQVIDDDGKPDRKINPLYDFTVGDADELETLLVGYLKAFGGQEARQITFVADGAHWIWKRVAKIRESLELEARGVEVFEVQDFFHAVEHLWEIARMPRRWSDSRRKQWVTRLRRALKRGELGDVQDALEAVRDEVSKRQLPALEREQAYFWGESEDRMRYAEFKRQRVPMGSGVIESAIRRVINQRVKSNGTFWTIKNVEVVMHLRAQLKSRRFDEAVLRATTPQAALRA